MRILGIDFGEKRVGLAISDPELRLATPYSTLQRSSDKKLISDLQRIVAEEDIDGLVVGLPRNVDGSLGTACERIQRFGSKLEERFELTVDYVDETLTSVEATERLREAGVNLRKHRAKIDAVAAQIILQEALDRRRAGEGAV